MEETRLLTLNMQVVEAGAKTTADIGMTTSDGEIMHGRGTARRHPDDPEVPQVGDEIAVVRALFDMGHELLDHASREIGERQRRHIDLPA